MMTKEERDTVRAEAQTMLRLNNEANGLTRISLRLLDDLDAKDAEIDDLKRLADASRDAACDHMAKLTRERDEARAEIERIKDAALAGALPWAHESLRRLKDENALLCAVAEAAVKVAEFLTGRWAPDHAYRDKRLDPLVCALRAAGYVMRD